MKITAPDIRACRLPDGLPGPGSLRGGAGNRECVVYTLHTDDG